MPPYIVSIINLKGGVGKTTTSVALAEHLASQQKRVLLIDLDPQTNATFMLIGDRRWDKLNGEGRTLATLFEDAVEQRSPRFRFDEALVKSPSDVKQAKTLDLLAASLDMTGLQRRLHEVTPGPFFVRTPTTVLAQAIGKELRAYDFVIIDCPPNLDVLTLNGLALSHGYVIPTIPDYLSTYGIPQIVQQVRRFGEALQRTIEQVGVLITKFTGTDKNHIAVAAQLGGRHTDGRPFATRIPQSTHLSAIAERTSASYTLAQKYAVNGKYPYADFTVEFLARIGRA